MSNLTNKLLQAMDIIVDQKLANSNRDITVEAKVESKEPTGKYTVSYNSTIYDGVSANGSYLSGDMVLLLVPQGDFSKEKTILSKIGQSQSDEARAFMTIEDQYNFIGGNLVVAQNDLGAETLWSRNVANNKISLMRNNRTDQVEYILDDYVSLYHKLKVSAKFTVQAAFGNDMDVDEGNDINYGIRFTFENNKVYEMNINDIAGNPYSLNGQIQTKLFEFEENVGKIQEISLFKTAGVSSFSISDFTIYGAIDPTKEGKSVWIQTPDGTTLSVDKSSLSFEAIVRHNGEIVTDISNLTFEWNVEDKGATSGWRELSSVKGNNKLTLRNDDIWLRNSIIVCKVIDGLEDYSNEVEVTNLNRPEKWFEITKTDNADKTLYILSITKADTNYNLPSNLQYEWSLKDPSGRPLPLGVDNEGEAIYNPTTATIEINPSQIGTGYVICSCEVKNKDGVWLGVDNETVGAKTVNIDTITTYYTAQKADVQKGNVPGWNEITGKFEPMSMVDPDPDSIPEEKTRSNYWWSNAEDAQFSENLPRLWTFEKISFTEGKDPIITEPAMIATWSPNVYRMDLTNDGGTIVTGPDGDASDAYWDDPNTSTTVKLFKGDKEFTVVEAKNEGWSLDVTSNTLVFTKHDDTWTIDVQGFSDNNASTSDDNKTVDSGFLVITLEKIENGTPIITLEKQFSIKKIKNGADGASPKTLSLSNDFDTIVYTSDGNRISDLPIITISAYEGTTPQTLTTSTLEIVPSNGIEGQFSESDQKYTVTTVNEGTINFTWAGITKTFTLKKIVSNADYDLLLPQTTFNNKQAGIITLAIQAKDGSGNSIIDAYDANSVVQIYDENNEIITDWSQSFTAGEVAPRTYILKSKDGDFVWDKETVEFVSDGGKGDAATSYWITAEPSTVYKGADGNYLENFTTLKFEGMLQIGQESARLFNGGDKLRLRYCFDNNGEWSNESVEGKITYGNNNSTLTLNLQALMNDVTNPIKPYAISCLMELKVSDQEWIEVDQETVLVSDQVKSIKGDPYKIYTLHNSESKAPNLPARVSDTGVFDSNYMGVENVGSEEEPNIVTYITDDTRTQTWYKDYLPPISTNSPWQWSCDYTEFTDGTAYLSQPERINPKDATVTKELKTIYCGQPAISINSTQPSSDSSSLPANYDLTNEILGRQPWPGPSKPNFDNDDFEPLGSLTTSSNGLSIDYSVDIKNTEDEIITYKGTVNCDFTWTWLSEPPTQSKDNDGVITNPYIYKSEQTVFNNDISSAGWSEPKIHAIWHEYNLTPAQAELMLLGGGKKGLFTSGDGDVYLNADLIKTGALVVQGNGNEKPIFSANVDTKEVTMGGWKVTENSIRNIPDAVSGETMPIAGIEHNSAVQYKDSSVVFWAGDSHAFENQLTFNASVPGMDHQNADILVGAVPTTMQSEDTGYSKLAVIISDYKEFYNNLSLSAPIEQAYEQTVEKTFTLNTNIDKSVYNNSNGNLAGEITQLNIPWNRTVTTYCGFDYEVWRDGFADGVALDDTYDRGMIALFDASQTSKPLIYCATFEPKKFFEAYGTPTIATVLYNATGASFMFIEGIDFNYQFQFALNHSSPSSTPNYTNITLRFYLFRQYTDIPGTSMKTGRWGLNLSHTVTSLSCEGSVVERSEQWPVSYKNTPCNTFQSNASLINDEWIVEDFDIGCDTNFQAYIEKNQFDAPSSLIVTEMAYEENEWIFKALIKIGLPTVGTQVRFLPNASTKDGQLHQYLQFFWQRYPGVDSRDRQVTISRSGIFSTPALSLSLSQTQEWLQERYTDSRAMEKFEQAKESLTLDWPLNIAWEGSAEDHESQKLILKQANTKTPATARIEFNARIVLTRHAMYDAAFLVNQRGEAHLKNIDIEHGIIDTLVINNSQVTDMSSAPVEIPLLQYWEESLGGKRYQIYLTISRDETGFINDNIIAVAKIRRIDNN